MINKTVCFQLNVQNIYELGFALSMERNPFSVLPESDTKILQSIYFAYKVGIISSYSNTTEKIKYVQCTIEKIQ